MTRWKRTVPALLVLLIASSPVVYYQAGNLVYTQAAANSPDCSGHSARNSPDEFSVELWQHEDVTTVTHQKNETLATNLEPLWFDHWENVSIDVPNESITLAGWVMEHGTDDPWVIVVHGIRSCKANHEALIPAAWLYQAGYNVILFDMRAIMGTAQQKTVWFRLVNGNIGMFWRCGSGFKTRRVLNPNTSALLVFRWAQAPSPSLSNKNQGFNRFSLNRLIPPWAM